jgi:tRNA nucleotidyltransferase (CCA-adding enzyme)
MFYNLHTKQVEDFTERGLAVQSLFWNLAHAVMQDLAAGIIRTPLAPLETLKDDPLRALRAIRFSARFNFKVLIILPGA